MRVWEQSSLRIDCSMLCLNGLCIAWPIFLSEHHNSLSLLSRQAGLADESRIACSCDLIAAIYRYGSTLTNLGEGVL